jgi:hypothetical protein
MVLAGALVSSRRIASAVRGELNGAIQPLVSLGAATRGVVFETAAINSDGSIAACFRCSSGTTVHLGTGIYQVGFIDNVTAARGWSRWVQVDTLSQGSISNVSCTTADRAGVASAVWVACFDNSTGNGADTSFFLFVAR